MQLVREQVFETNSSSCHSVSIASTEHVLDTIVPDDDGIIRVQADEYGWGIEDIYDAKRKLGYCYQQAGDNEARLAVLVSAVCAHTGAVGIELIPTGSTWSPNGYIDHQSVGVIEELFDDSAVSDGEVSPLIDLIFNPASFVSIDNDNH